MSRSYLQEPFMKEVAATFQATARRITQRLANARADETQAIVEDELRGLYHGMFVILDGGTALANQGLVRIADEDGVAFDRFLHEICFGFWPESGRTSD
jgi:hypothetical protein